MPVLAPIFGADLPPETVRLSGGTERAGRSRKPSVEALEQFLPRGDRHTDTFRTGKTGPCSRASRCLEGLYKSERVPVLLLNRSASIPIF